MGCPGREVCRFLLELAWVSVGLGGLSIGFVDLPVSFAGISAGFPNLSLKFTTFSVSVTISSGFRGSHPSVGEVSFPYAAGLTRLFLHRRQKEYVGPCLKHGF